MHAQYVKTHGRFDPGEQRTRNYSWDQIGMDPANTVFGRKNKADEFGAAVVVNPLVDPANWSETIVSARLAAFKLAEAEPLGKPHVRGAGPLQPQSEGFRYGVPSRRAHVPDDGGAKACFSMPMTQEQFNKTGDLGRSKQLPGAKPTDPARIFGLPSVRRDLVAPPVGKRSVADHRTFGNEATTAQLIAPRPGADL